MQRSLIRKEVLPFVLMFGSLIAATLIGDALLHQFDLIWIGRWLGIPGTLLILASFLYSLRKRKKIAFGKPKTLLWLHETLTWLGALMILVHAGIHVYAILPWLALASMLINVFSGMTGRFYWIAPNVSWQPSARSTAARDLPTTRSRSDCSGMPPPTI